MGYFIVSEVVESLMGIPHKSELKHREAIIIPLEDISTSNKNLIQSSITPTSNKNKKETLSKREVFIGMGFMFVYVLLIMVIIVLI